MNQANSAGEETILIVDDEEVNRAILSNLFCTQYTILEAADGLEGLSVIESCGDSLRAILLDVVMPRMDGIRVLRKLHASGLTSRVPVFLITAEAGGSTMREAYELGVMDVIFKPVVPFLVIRRVNSVVELFRARRLLGAEVERQRDQLLLHYRYDLGMKQEDIAARLQISQVQVSRLERRILKELKNRLANA